MPATYTLTDVITARRQGYVDRCNEEYQQSVAQSLQASTLSSDTVATLESVPAPQSAVQSWAAAAAAKYPFMITQPRVVTDPDDPTVSYQVINGVLQVKTATADWAPATSVTVSSPRLQALAMLFGSPTELVQATA